MPRPHQILVVSAHVGAVAWLQDQFPEAEVIYDKRPRPHQVHEADSVVGSWPMQIIAGSHQYYVVEFENRPFTTGELSVKQMHEAGAHLVPYTALPFTRIELATMLTQEPTKLLDIIHGKQL